MKQPASWLRSVQAVGPLVPCHMHSTHTQRSVQQDGKHTFSPPLTANPKATTQPQATTQHPSSTRCLTCSAGCAALSVAPAARSPLAGCAARQPAEQSHSCTLKGWRALWSHSHWPMPPASRQASGQGTGSPKRRPSGLCLPHTQCKYSHPPPTHPIPRPSQVLQDCPGLLQSRLGP